MNVTKLPEPEAAIWQQTVAICFICELINFPREIVGPLLCLCFQLKEEYFLMCVFCKLEVEVDQEKLRSLILITISNQDEIIEKMLKINSFKFDIEHFDPSCLAAYSADATPSNQTSSLRMATPKTNLSETLSMGKTGAGHYTRKSCRLHQN